MIVELDFGQIIGLLTGFFAAVWAFWRFTEARREKESDRRWSEMYEHLDTQNAAQGSRMDDYGKRISELEKGVEGVRARLSGIPSNAEFSKLVGDVAEMKGAQQSIHRELSGLNSGIAMLNDFLLNRGRA